MTIQLGIIGLFALMVLIGALWVVTLRSLFRAAMSLGLVLVGVAGIFLVLGAEFLAFAQILIYVGAILTLVVFAIMLTAKLHAANVAPASRQTGPAALASLGLFIMLASITPVFAPPPAGGEAVTLAALGQQLVTTLILPFEVISLVFVVAMVGAIAVAATRRDKTSS